MAACRLKRPLATRRKNWSDHCSWLSPPGDPNARRWPSGPWAIEGVSVVRGLEPGRRDEAKPSSSQNIWPRVPRGKPRAGMTGEPCSHPPDGVAATVAGVAGVAVSGAGAVGAPGAVGTGAGPAGAVQQAQRLQGKWPLGPRAGFEDLPAGKVNRPGWLVGGRPAGQVLAGQQTSFS